jgi:two-component system, NarL family, sensor histidine kinase UhpB
MPAEMACNPFFDRLASALLALFALLCLSLPAGTARAQALTFADALTADDKGEGHFPAEAVTRVVSLPDDWARTRPQAHTPLWYRLRFDAAALAATPGPLAVFIERACANVEIQINGQILHAAGRMSDPISLDCQRPLLLALPGALLQERGNTLDLRLAGYALQQVASSQRAGGLSAPTIGPYAALQARHARDSLLAATLPLAASALLLLSGAVVLTLARSRSRDSHLRYFGALALAWAPLTARLWWPDLPLDVFHAELLLACLPPLATLAAVQFLLHYAGWRSRPIEVALFAQCLAVPASLLVAGPLRVHALSGSWHALLVVQVLAAMVFYLGSTRRARRRDFWFVAPLLGVSALMTLLELAAQNGWLPPSWRFVSRIAMPLTMVAMALHLVRQQGRALQSAEDGRLALELRVHEAGAEMEKAYAHRAEQRVEQVTQQERKRIAADLHDDLGAKLLTIVHTSESERISTLAREALEEMRLSVRGLTGKPVKLIDALGDWRAEVVGRLSQTGVEGEWSAPSDELPQTLSARAYVQTTRILREAVNNIIKHSGASRCSIRCLIDSGDFSLAIQDNGKGIPLELDGRLDRGHGMASMKHRAKQLHGQCLVESGPGYGTVIRLTIPLERHTTTA